LNDLASLRIPAGFFLTGNFLRNEANAFFLRRLVRSGHYLGPHSDAHLEYADGYGRTLVSHSIFQNDLLKNITALSRFTALAEGGNRYWIFPFETGNAELSRWSEDLGWKPFSFSPGLLTQTDYIREGERGFIQSDIILENFRARLRRNEMPGSIFLMHTGSGGRKDRVSALIPTMAAELRANGYTFARIDRLLAGCR